jgi:hypothetical protein
MEVNIVGCEVPTEVDGAGQEWTKHCYTSYFGEEIEVEFAKQFD